MAGNGGHVAILADKRDPDFLTSRNPRMFQLCTGKNENKKKSITFGTDLG